MESSILEDFARLNLALGLQQSKYAADFLRLFKVIIKDEKYVDRFKRHYFLFKEIVEPKHFKAGKYIKK